MSAKNKAFCSNYQQSLQGTCWSMVVGARVVCLWVLSKDQLRTQRDPCYFWPGQSGCIGPPSLGEGEKGA